jgi:hypothetical protein
MTILLSVRLLITAFDLLQPLNFLQYLLYCHSLYCPRQTTIYKALHKTLNLEQEEYEDIKGAIRIVYRRRTDNTIKLGMNSGDPEG